MTASTEERRLKLDGCRAGFHEAYMSQCLLGYDLICRNCRRVRYRDVNPPQWDRFDRARGSTTYKDADGTWWWEDAQGVRVNMGK